MQAYLNDFIDNFIKGIPNLLTALVIFVVSIYLAAVVSRIVRRVLALRKAPEGVTHLLSQLTRWAVIIAGTITALQRFFDVTAFLAGLGIIGFTVGFALQDVMKNFAAGIILLIQQPFHIGDAIGVKEYEGTVMEIDLRATEMKTFDGRIVILPNAEVLANPIVNYTRADRRRVDLLVGIPYETDAETARKAVLEAIKGVPGIVAEPEAMVGFSSFGDSTLQLSAFFWIDMTKTNPLAAKDEALTRIKATLENRGIHNSLPAQIVYLQTQK
ncbi:MAG: mechanosensitive ion channel [Chloroflexi bacterium]|nr:mechanosensitive ion channel [Chloroflexota bacterium]